MLKPIVNIKLTQVCEFRGSAYGAQLEYQQGNKIKYRELIKVFKQSKSSLRRSSIGLKNHKN